MGFPVSITESAILTVLRSFLLSVLPSGVEVVRGLVNRVPEPAGADFCVMTPLFRDRLGTNVDTVQDCAFTGSITGNTMTVSNVTLGVIGIGNTLWGSGVASGTMITGQTGGLPGSAGTYTVSPAQTVASGTLACGTKTSMQSTKITIQCDIHGPNSGDNSQTVSTLFRDEYATLFFQPTLCSFTGSIAGTTLTVSAIASGAIVTGMLVTSSSVAPQTIISAQLTGNPGDVGTYTIGPTQTVSSGPMRGSPTFTISPLYSEDPRQLVFTNAEQQAEERWIVDFVMQADPILTLPQQFSQEVSVTPIEADA